MFVWVIGSGSVLIEVILTTEDGDTEQGDLPETPFSVRTSTVVDTVITKEGLTEDFLEELRRNVNEKKLFIFFK